MGQSEAGGEVKAGEFVELEEGMEVSQEDEKQVEEASGDDAVADILESQAEENVEAQLEPLVDIDDGGAEETKESNEPDQEDETKE